MAHGPDVISQSWHRVLNTPHCLVPPGRDQHQVGYSTQGPSTSKSSSPQQVKLQIHPGNEGQTASQHEQLLFGLPPDLKGGTANRTQTFSTESKPFGQRDYRNYGHVTAPSTPSGTRKTYGQVCEGKRSIVTYSYIEKANVRSVGDNNSTLFQNEPENLFRKAFNDQTIHFSKNVPSRFHRQEMISNSNEKKTLTGSVTNPQETSSLQLTMLHSNTKNATHQPLKQFGSPNLRQHLATANSPDQSYGTLHREQPRCHSWSGSPVVTRISKTLPVNAHLLDLNHRSHLHGITSRLTAHNLSSDAKQPYPMSFSNNGQSQAISSQQVWKSDETMRQGYRHCAIFSSSKSTASQDQIVNKTVTEPPHNQTVGQKTSPNPRPVNKDNCSLKLSSPTQSLSESLKADSTRSGHQSTQEFSTRTSSGTNFFAHEPHWEQKPGQTRYSTSFINLHKVGIMSTPTIQEPQQEREVSVGKKSPVSRQHQPPRYTDGNNIPSQEDNNFNGSYSHGFRESPDFMITRFVSTSKHHWKERHFSKWTGNTKKENLNAEESLVAPLVMDKESRNDSFVLSTKETYFIDPAHKDIRVEEEQNNALHQSSSGFTGSAVEVIQPERDAISPMTSSQNIQRSSDAQLDSGSSLLGPSLQCQRTARAKWEFLFGKPLEDEYRVTVPVSSFDPNGYSNGSPYEFTDSNSSDQPISNIPNTSSYDVQHLDMEPFNPPLPSAPDSSTKTGIIRRTIKYSETDLDAVPLRCYRETDIDEVILAEQEKINLAISNNRSVMATSDINSRKLFCSQTSEKEDQQYDDEITNRASVRRNCDKKRQQAVQDGDEVFSRLFEGSKNGQSDSFTAITAPVTVDSPSRSSTDDLDSFSRHFESIMESHRAKGTSYSSLDSEDIGSSGFPIFTFDFTTLTPEIQSQICKSAKQIVDLSFASLGQPETSSILTPSTSEALAGAEQCTSEEEHELTDRVSAENHISSESTKAMTQRERASGLVLQSDHVVAQRLALGRNDNIPNGAKADLPTAKLLAKRLYNLDGFRRSEIARHLGKNDNFSTMVAEEYLSYFNFAGMSVDQALRVFLREFALIGETQERERVLSHFSRRYLQCNPNTIPNLDSIHTLTCALMLLNTDLHGHNVGKRMSCTQFISNMEGLNGGQNFPKDLLKALYNSIKNEKLQWTIDEEDVRKSVSELADSRKDSASHTLRRITSGGAPLVSLAQQSNTQVHKKGFLVRKVHADPDGKRTPRGKRGWKTFYAILKGLVLYLQRSEYGAPKQLSHEDLKNAVSIHHSLAMKAADYSKRPNVFYLRTADWRIFLFQAPNAEQMQSWITRINTVAAMFSAPPFPAAIGSQKRFSRPLLPGSTTKLSQVEQMKSHEMHFRSVSTELQELRSVPRERKSKAKEQEETKQRDGYLEFEKTRYGTYAMLLRAKIRTRESDLTAFEACLFTDGTLQHTGSSPTLAHDTSHASASSCSSRSKKSSRSESQRHKPAVKQ